MAEASSEGDKGVVVAQEGADAPENGMCMLGELPATMAFGASFYQGLF